MIYEAHSNESTALQISPLAFNRNVEQSEYILGRGSRSVPWTSEYAIVDPSENNGQYGVTFPNNDRDFENTLAVPSGEIGTPDSHWNIPEPPSKQGQFPTGENELVHTTEDLEAATRKILGPLTDADATFGNFGTCGEGSGEVADNISRLDYFAFDPFPLPLGNNFLEVIDAPLANTDINMDAYTGNGTPTSLYPTVSPDIEIPSNPFANMDDKYFLANFPNPALASSEIVGSRQRYIDQTHCIESHAGIEHTHGSTEAASYTPPMHRFDRFGFSSDGIDRETSQVVHNELLPELYTAFCSEAETPNTADSQKQNFDQTGYKGSCTMFNNSHNVQTASIGPALKQLPYSPEPVDQEGSAPSNWTLQCPAPVITDVAGTFQRSQFQPTCAALALTSGHAQPTVRGNSSPKHPPVTEILPREAEGQNVYINQNKSPVGNTMPRRHYPSQGGHASSFQNQHSVTILEEEMQGTAELGHHGQRLGACNMTSDVEVHAKEEKRNSNVAKVESVPWESLTVSNSLPVPFWDQFPSLQTTASTEYVPPPMEQNTAAERNPQKDSVISQIAHKPENRPKRQVGRPRQDLGIRKTIVKKAKRLKEVEDRKRVCDVCGDKFRSEENMSRHRLHHDGETPFTCEQCGAPFQTSRMVSMHQSRVHGKKTKKEVLPFLECPYCSEVKVGSCSLKRHIRIRHQNDKPFICRTCSKAFSTKHNMTIHARKVHKPKAPKQQK